MLTRRHFIGLAASLPILGFAARPAMAEPEVFSADGLAIRGADPVAFFTSGGVEMGSADHMLMWRGTYWRFASAENQAMFEADPEAFAPQYGGYCAFAMSRGYIASTVPEAWTIHEGKLYLNYSLSVRERWLRDVPGNIASADPYWPSILTA